MPLPLDSQTHIEKRDLGKRSCARTSNNPYYLLIFFYIFNIDFLYKLLKEDDFISDFTN